MKQNRIFTIAAAKNAADLIIGGINELGATIPLHYNAKDQIVEEITNMIMANGIHEQAKQLKATRRDTMVAAIDVALQKIRVVRDLLKLTLGYEYSDSWTLLGFQDKLALPTDIEDIKAILQAMIQYYTANPTLEFAALGATAAELQALLDSLIAAQQAFVSQDATVKELMDSRDGEFAVVCKRIGGVYRELGNHLGSLDRRWLKYGFNIPGADETPEQVEHVQVTLLGPTAAAVKWPATVRAQYFRVWKKVIGVDTEPVAVGSPADLDFTIENLPTNSTVEVYVSAVNNGGESPLSEKITIVTHA